MTFLLVWSKWQAWISKRSHVYIWSWLYDSCLDLVFSWISLRLICVGVEMVLVCCSSDLHASSFFYSVGVQFVVEVNFLLFRSKVKEMVEKGIPVAKSL